MRCIPKSILVAAAAVATLLISTAHAQSTKRYEFGRDSRTKQILFIKNKKAYTPRYERGLTLKSGVQTLAAAPYQSLTDSTIKTDPVLAADKFLRSNASKFGVSAGSLYPQKVEIDSIGMAHVRYQQRYRDIPVFGGGLIVHVGANNIVTAANGRVARRISAYVPSERLQLSEDEVREIARNFWFAEYGREVTPVVEVRGSYIYSPTFLGTVNYSVNATPSPTASASPRPSASPYGSSTPVPTSTPRISSRLSYGDYVYRVVAHSEETHNTQIYFVDGRTGELRGRESGVRNIQRVITDCSRGICRVNGETGVYPGYVFGRSEGTPERGPCPVPEYSGSLDTDRLFSLLGSVHDYYQLTFNRNGANANGGNSFGSGNAYTGEPWSISRDVATSGRTFVADGCPAKIAGINITNGSLGFCHGSIDDDIVGHEYAHGISLFSHVDGGGIPIGMAYLGESGALDESLADVFGIFFEAFRNGTTDWIIDLPVRGVIRDLRRPSSESDSAPQGHPSSFYSDSFYCGAADNGGVHSNSTVPSHAFYLITNGGVHNGCSINGIGVPRAQAVLFRAVTQYYHQAETFNAAYNSIIHACTDLYPDGTTCASVTAALQAVELDQPGACSGLPPRPPACAQAPICTDSDGTDTLVAGSVTFDGKAYADRCIGLNSISEAVCSNGALSYLEQSCVNGCSRIGGAHCL